MSKKGHEQSINHIYENLLNIPEGYREMYDQALSSIFNIQSVKDIEIFMYDQIKNEVHNMLSILQYADAFDVIELMRLREFGVNGAVNEDGWALIVEIISAILLSRPSRSLEKCPEGKKHIYEYVSELHFGAKYLADIALISNLAAASIDTNRFANFSASYRSYILCVRNLQYDHIRQNIEKKLFQNDAVSSLMQKYLGYTSEDLCIVQDAVEEILARRLTDLRDKTGSIVAEYSDRPHKDIPQLEKDVFMDAMNSLIFFPGDRATITVDNITSITDLDMELVVRILDSYSQNFSDEISAEDRVYRLLNEENAFLRKPLVSDGDGKWILTTLNPGIDSLRRILEDKLSGNDKDLHKYDRIRSKVSEEMSIECIKKIFKTGFIFSNFYYYAPKKGLNINYVNSSCSNLNNAGNRAECDGLIVIDDVAIIVEVKAKSFSNKAREGNFNRIKRDVQVTIGDASRQITRLYDLINSNGGLWNGDGCWIDLSNIREMRSIIVLLDDIGPAASQLIDLQELGILGGDNSPWVVSLHDLMIIADICERPGEFLLYIRRRTEGGIPKYYHASDELDYFMLFLKGKLYVEDNPDEVHSIYPTSSVKKMDRQLYERSAVNTFIGNQCQPLDEWYSSEKRYYLSEKVEKPRFEVSDKISSIVDYVANENFSGWLRFSADIFGLSDEAQKQLLNDFSSICRESRQDRCPHILMSSYAGIWGNPSVFIQVIPNVFDLRLFREKILLYMRAKSYQIKSDRSYGIISDSSGNILDFLYLTDPPEADPELDDLILKLRLRPVGDRSQRRYVPGVNRKKSSKLKKRNKRHVKMRKKKKK